MLWEKIEVGQGRAPKDVVFKLKSARTGRSGGGAGQAAPGALPGSVTRRLAQHQLAEAGQSRRPGLRPDGLRS